LSNKEKTTSATMFDNIGVEQWIDGMSNFSTYDVEFYMWGGEPFCIDETFSLVKGFCAFEHVKWARIDHNMTKVDKIIKLCPSPKVKINCSWHTERFSFEEILQKTMMLKKHDMVGMVNFVASDSNLKYLKENSLNIDDLIKRFMDEGIFMNVAADFSKGNNSDYRKFITRYMTFDDWEHIHNLRPSFNACCTAGESLFTVEHNGNLSVCADDSIIGNYFSGELQRKRLNCQKKDCPSIISYCHRLDNDFSPVKHLEHFAIRTAMHRRKTGIIE
jgi:hypothetical protein